MFFPKLSLGSLACSISLPGEEAPHLVGSQGVQLAVAELRFKLRQGIVVIPDGTFLQLALWYLKKRSTAAETFMLFLLLADCG